MVTTGSVGNTYTVIHSFVPSATTSYPNMIAHYAATFNDASATQMYWQIIVGGTVTGYTPGSVGGTVSGGTVVKYATEHLDAGVNVTTAFSTMFAYTAGQAVTLVASAGTGSGSIATSFDSELMVDSGV